MAIIVPPLNPNAPVGVAYCTAEQVRAQGGIGDDTLLDMYAAVVSADITNKLGSFAAPPTEPTEFVTHTSTGIVRLPSRVSVISSVAVNGFQTERYTVQGRVLRLTKPRRSYSTEVPYGGQRQHEVVVLGVFGYPTVPVDVAMSTARLAALTSISAVRDDRLTSRSVEGYSQSWGTGAAGTSKWGDPLVDRWLAPYEELS